ncbi:MAG: hypothetical protein FGM58_10860 [Acidimicrobiia bacterium]|nr:hypothetical protein [Acidimicrobiia bacterium]
MSGRRTRSSVTWLIGGLVMIAVLVGVSAALRSRAVGPADASRSASSSPLVGSGLVVRNALPVSVGIDSFATDPFYEGRDISRAAPLLGFSRRELGSGVATVGSVDGGARPEDNGRWLVGVTRVDGVLIGSFELEWAVLARSCVTRAVGVSATQDCEEQEGWWLAGLVAAEVTSGCPGPASREIGSIVDPSGAVQRVEVVAECSSADVGAGPTTLLEVRAVPMVR